MHWDSKTVKGWSLISLFDCKIQNSEACYLKQQIKDNTESKITDFSSHRFFFSLEITAVFCICQPTGTHQTTYWKPTRSWQSTQELAEDCGCLFQGPYILKWIQGNQRIQGETDQVRVKGQASEHILTHSNFSAKEHSPWTLNTTRRKQGYHKLYICWKPTIDFNIYN